MRLVRCASLFGIGLVVFSLTSAFSQADELDMEFKEIRVLLKAASPPHLSSSSTRRLPRRQQARRVNLHQVILDASRTANLDPAVLATLIKIESGFDPDALSHTGARGLTQLMPNTAKQLGISNVWDPKANATGGARWLTGLLKEHDGNLLAALASYNAGSRVMRRSWNRWPRETRRYLEKFVRYYPQISQDWKKYTPQYIYSHS